MATQVYLCPLSTFMSCFNNSGLALTNGLIWTYVGGTVNTPATTPAHRTSATFSWQPKTSRNRFLEVHKRGGHHATAVNAARAVGADRKTVNKYAEKMVRGIRRTGELIRQIPKPEGRPKNNCKTDFTVFTSEASITRMTAWNWEQIAAIPEADFEATLTRIREAVKELTAEGLSQREIASVVGVGQATVHRDSNESKEPIDRPISDSNESPANILADKRAAKEAERHTRCIFIRPPVRASLRVAKPTLH